MPDAGPEQLKGFLFESVRSRLAAQMLALCGEHRVKLVSVADFAARLEAPHGDVARVMIDWTRKGIFRPSASGRYVFCASPETRQLVNLFCRTCATERGRKDLARSVLAIERNLVEKPEDLPEIWQPPAPAPAPAKQTAATGGAGRAERTERPPLPITAEISAEAIKQVRRYVSTIPPLPLVAQQLLREVADPNSSARSMSNIAIKDPVIVMSLLKLANSAFYGQVEEVTDVQRAIVVVGLNNVKHMLLASGLGRIFKQPRDVRGYNFTALWTHALGVSVAARLLVRRTRVMSEVEAGTLGLLHDIGKFAMNVTRPELTEQLLDPFQGPEGVSGLAKEVSLFGTTHALYGMTLLETWKLPNEFARVVEYHHHPSFAEKEGLEEHTRKSVALVHIANQLAKMGGLECGDREIEEVPEGCFALLGLPPGLDALLDKQLGKTFEHVKFFVEAAIGGARPGTKKPQEKPPSP
jgi:HD-like signal output (HDOD) protein